MQGGDYSEVRVPAVGPCRVDGVANSPSAAVVASYLLQETEINASNYKTTNSCYTIKVTITSTFNYKVYVRYGQTKSALLNIKVVVWFL